MTSVDAPMDLVQRMLDAEGARTMTALLAAIPESEPRRHLYELVGDYPRRGGKFVRASICLATCRAFGGTTEQALGVAVVLELLHNSFLIRDDIQDGALMRRGEPTLHLRYGLPRALNASDGLSALALGELARACRSLPPAVASQLLDETGHMMRRTVEGQATELGWVVDQRDDLTEVEYLEMVTNKTSWYTTVHPCRIGALIGSDGRADLDRLVPFTLRLGALFQLRDDLDNLMMRSGPRADGTYGKDAGYDIVEGKRTLILAHFWRHAAAPDRAEMLRCLGPAGRGDEQERIEVAIDLLQRSGSIAYARRFAAALATVALTEYQAAFRGVPRSADLDFMVALIPYLLGPWVAAQPTVAT
jgi:geranylgeranyl diphosphate synthase, type II